mgnify:CR=1 FL=1
MQIPTISYLEKKLVSSKNRFSLNIIQNKEINRKLNGSNILIIGAAGSIGSEFSLKLLKKKFKKIFLLDKDENELTELNRKINLSNFKKINKLEYICSDAINFPFQKFVKKKDINHIFNFSALKHVRSEENILSVQYMFGVNSISFLNKKFPKNLKSIFSISTDKVNKPQSMLGISKKLMENVLAEIKSKNQKIHVSSVRFTNVSFSKGSILKNIFDKAKEGKAIGLPRYVNRYFITHNEAVTLCLKTLLKNNNGFIVQPSPNNIGKNLSIYNLSLKILKLLNLNPVRKKFFLKANEIQIIPQSSISQGQKLTEDLSSDNEIYLGIKNDKSIIKTKFLRLRNLSQILRELKVINSRAKIVRIAKKIYKYYNFDNSRSKISYTI